MAAKGPPPTISMNRLNTPLRIDATTIPTFEPPSPTYSEPQTPNESNISEDEEDYMELELQRVKELFLRHQYKECVARCAELLPAKKSEPAHEAFLHFYTAVSYEEIARSQHHQSPHVVGNIDLAAKHYNDATNALPPPIVPERKPRHVLVQPDQRRVEMIDFATNLRDDLSVYDASVYEYDESRESSTSCSDRSSLNSSVYSEESASTAPSTAPSAGPFSPTDTKSTQSADDDWFNDEPDSPIRKPSPLRVHKQPSHDSFYEGTLQALGIFTSAQQPDTEKSPDVPNSPTKPESAEKSPETSWLCLDSDSEDENEEEVREILQLLCAPRDLRKKNIHPSDRKAVQRFNAHLTSFYEMLENHAYNLELFREKVIMLQSKERGRPPTKQERIARGRETGWKRPRFDAERYQALCDEVLADL